ncbi:signal peptidase I [Thermosulfidibacter takaii]|uniref:signal peptidase I n=1 Tax=Thermosulfidibacter takaii TaxID=412593 RepID=UPI0008384AB4
MFSKKTEEVTEAKSFVDVLKDWLKDIAVALIIALIIRALFIQAFRIPSGSMIPTLLIGDHLLVEKVSYRFRKPKRFEIIVFKFPLNRKVDYIKRVIGLPGDTVKIVNKQVYVNGKKLNEPYVQHTDPAVLPADVSPRDNFGPVKVPEGHLFVMGDNRDNSYDSRFWGFVPEKDIVGRAFIIYFSCDSKSFFSLRCLTHIRWRRIGKLIH